MTRDKNSPALELYHFQDNDFFVTGESYAGKYIPAISYKIHQANKDLEEKERKINFKVRFKNENLCTMFHVRKVEETIGENVK